MPRNVLADCGTLVVETRASSLSKRLSSAAGYYTRFRSNSSMFVIYDRDRREIEVVSAVGELAVEDQLPEFPLKFPVYLMRRAIEDLASVHVPDIRGDIIGNEETWVEFHSDAKIMERSYSSGSVFGLLPNGFDPLSGSLLLTPLCMEEETDLVLGFIQEYRAQGPFSLKSIQDARHYSAFFFSEIVDRYLNEISAKMLR